MNENYEICQQHEAESAKELRGKTLTVYSQKLSMFQIYHVSKYFGEKHLITYCHITNMDFFFNKFEQMEKFVGKK